MSENVRWVANRFSFLPGADSQKRGASDKHAGHWTRRDRRVNRRNVRDALLTLFGVISVVNGAFGNGHLLIAMLGAVALAFVAWQRWQTHRTASA